MTTRSDDTTPEEAEDRFWEVAEPLLARAGVTRSTMMGFPCLRVEALAFVAGLPPSPSRTTSRPRARRPAR